MVAADSTGAATPARAPVAIVSAIDDELHALIAVLRDARSVQIAGRTFHHGEIAGHPVVLVRSGMGKVAAATTAALVLQVFGARQLVFTGVAGGLREGVDVGDVVVARQLLQHDMDASPLFPRFEVPATGRSHFDCDADLSDALADAARHCLAGADALIGDGPRALGIGTASVHRGLIVSGDCFVATAARSAALRALLPDALAVEMEGAAVAQVCTDFGRPFAVLRTVSDRADAAAHVDFRRFVADVAGAYTRAIVEAWLQSEPRR